MTRLLRDLRAFGIALAAVAGVLSVSGTASACSAGAAGKATSSCCTARPDTACGCCGEAVDVPSPAVGTRVDSHHEAGSRVIPAGRCVCRPERPPVPAGAPQSRPAERPSERLFDGAITVDAAPASAARLRSSPLSPSGSTPDAPVYLRTARLLF
jgi:hypothetical protein